MWQIILAITFTVIVVGLFWVFQPYFVWKKHFQNHEKDSITIHQVSGSNMQLSAFLESKHKVPIELSLVVPSYNEEERLPIMLDQTLAHLNKLTITYEIIIVNDGSKDKTTEAALIKGKQLKANLCVLEYPKNRGKGGAVRAGVAAATGNYVLMVDADGATTFSQFDRVFQRLKEMKEDKKHPLLMVVGSRAHLQEGKVERKFHRQFVSNVFRFIKSVVCGVKQKDTQCGFKLFTKQSAKMLFEAMHIERWAFDIELFVLSNILKVEIDDVAVEWRDIEGSKLNVVDASINMFRDLLVIRFLYLIGVWKANDKIVVS